MGLPLGQPGSLSVRSSARSAGVRECDAMMWEAGLSAANLEDYIRARRSFPHAKVKQKPGLGHHCQELRWKRRWACVGLLLSQRSSGTRPSGSSSVRSSARSSGVREYDAMMWDAGLSAAKLEDHIRARRSFPRAKVRNPDTLVRKFVELRAK